VVFVHRRPAQRDRIERDPPAQEGRERFQFQLRPLRAQLHADAGGVPEPAALGQSAGMGGLDEQVEDHRLAIGSQGFRLDPPDLDPFVEDRRAHRHRPAILRDQAHALAGGVGRGEGRVFQRGKPAARLANLAIPRGFDIRTRQHRLQPADSLQRDLRADDPELRAFVDEGGDFLVQPDGDDHLTGIGGKAHILDHADLDIAALYLGLARLDPRGAVQQDFDQRPPIGARLPRHPQRQHQGDERHQPHERYAAAGGFGIVEIAGFSVGHGDHAPQDCPRWPWDQNSARQAS